MRRALALSIVLSACAHSSAVNRTPNPQPAQPDSLRYGTVGQGRQCIAIGDLLDCPDGAKVDVSIGPMSEEGSAFCFAKCQKDGVDHGPYIIRDLERGRLEERGERYDGRYSGVWVTRARDGRDDAWQKTAEHHYKGFYLHGPWRTWHSNGRIATDGEYFKGDKHGEWTTRSPAGIVLSNGWYDRGTRIGVHVERYPNGQPKNREVFDEAGRPDGEFCFWKRDGTEIDCYTMELGTGVLRYYDDTGELLSQTPMQDGEQHGESVDYRHGKPTTVMTFRDGKRHGQTRTFAGDCISSEVHYRDGLQHGAYFLQDCDVDPPVKVMEGEWCDNNACGEWTERDRATGQVTAIIEYSPDGEPVAQTTFEDGVAVEQWYADP